MGTLDKILYLLQERHIEQQEFAKAIGIRKQAISEWKNGTTKSYMKYIGKIAEYFDVSTDYLLGNTPDPSVTGTSYAPPIVSKDVASIIEHYNELSGNGKEKAREYIEMLRALEERKGDSND